MTNPFTLLLLSLLVFLLAAVQWLLGFARPVGLLALAVLVVPIAAGSLDESCRARLAMLLPWLVALVAYKPVAAIIYAVGTPLMATGSALRTVMTGSMVMALAVLSMPALLRLLSWWRPSVTAGPAAGVLGAGATGAVPVAGLVGRGSAVTSARTLATSGPGSAPGLATPGGRS